MKRGVEKKMSLEEYIDFFISGDSSGYTIPYLNQIIHMHGYRKLHKSNKKTVGEAVDALELLDLSRSTLKQTAISSSSSLSLEEVITDIEALKWQECRLTSLEIFNSDEISQAVTNPKQKSNKRKKTTTRKKKKIQRSDEADDDMNSTVKALPKNSKRKRSAIVNESST